MTPVIFSTFEDKDFPEDLAIRIQTEKRSDEVRYLLSFPTVYIHFWPGKSIDYTDKKGKKRPKQLYNVYVGESNDILNRTKEHYVASQKETNWQYHLTHDKQTPQMIVVAHEHFNKSFTLDIENRLIEYIMPGRIDNLYNARGNPQNSYYPVDEFEKVFQSIWKGLRKINTELFLPVSDIENSALFKASPLKKLTEEQIDAKETIIAKIYEALERNLDGQLIIVQGEAGTGKTVLNSAIFYDLITRGEEYFHRRIECHLMVNHNQQEAVYLQMAKRLNLGEGIVHKPTSFINSHSPSSKVDVSFIDEGHLLLTQGKQSYTGHNQLEDIIKRSKVTVMMFDEYQVLTSEQYWEPDILEKFKSLSIRQNNYIGLSNQLRMNCSESTTRWISDLILNRRISKFEKDSKNYEVKSFDSPVLLERAIRDKASHKEDSLSRIIASYDWPYNQNSRPEQSKYWGVKIGNWFMPWNYELEKELDRKQRRHIQSQSWAEQEHTINEVGSTFTIQGFDLSYAGVILGPSIKYINNEIVFDPNESSNHKATQKRTLSDGNKKSFGETFIRNEIKVLLTRGVKGLYIYACDKELRKALKNKALI